MPKGRRAVGEDGVIAPSRPSVPEAQGLVEALQARIDTLELELREARDQQIATAEVLQFINSSPGDLAPVFEAMLEKAMRLCEAAFGQVFGLNGEQFDLLAVTAPAEFAAAVREYPAFRPPPRSALDRLVQGSRVVHIPDVADDPAFAPGSH